MRDGAEIQTQVGLTPFRHPNTLLLACIYDPMVWSYNERQTSPDQLSDVIS